jgi:hypothetical protein
MSTAALVTIANKRKHIVGVHQFSGYKDMVINPFKTLNGKKGMGEGGLRKSNKVVNMIKIHYVHI